MPRYLEAWERLHDYDLYCVLAGQFWPLDAEAFRAVDRPGKKLFLEIDTPARIIMKMWTTCWPFRKVGDKIPGLISTINLLLIIPRRVIE